MQSIFCALRTHTQTHKHTNTHTHTHTHSHTRTHTQPHTHLIVCLSIKGDLSFPTMRQRGRWLGRRCHNTGMWRRQLRGRRSPSINRHLRACRKAETHKQKQTSVKLSGPVACTHYLEYALAITTSLAPSSNVSQMNSKNSHAQQVACIFTSLCEPHRRLVPISAMLRPRLARLLFGIGGDILEAIFILKLASRISPL